MTDQNNGEVDMSDTVTEIILLKLDKLQDGQDKQTDKITQMEVTLAKIEQERRTDRAEVENLLNRGNQEMCNHVALNYVSNVKFPILLETELKKKKEETRANITFWQGFMKNTWDIIKIVMTIFAIQWLSSKGLFVTPF